MPSTGITHYWTYESRPIGGIGEYAINVSSGNGIVVGRDMNVPHRGVPLTFTRIYNTQSTHDYINDDGSIADNYGARWTNEYDMRIANNDVPGGISYFDATGARFDFTPIGSGGCTFQSPPGQFGILTCDGAGGYELILRSGVIYDFFNPSLSMTPGGKLGRLTKIWGRNHHTFIALNYTFDGTGDSSPYNLATITLQTESTLKATLTFGNAADGKRLLSSLTLPGGESVVYTYDTGDLTSVTLPDNGNTGRYVGYSYDASHVMLNTGDVNWYTTGAVQGHQISFGYQAGTKIVSGVGETGNVNPLITDDGTPSGRIQPGMGNPNNSTYYTASYTYTPLTGGNTLTTYFDTDAHSRQYNSYNQANSPSGTPFLVYASLLQNGSTMLQWNYTYGLNNNVKEIVDPNTNVTDAVYDPRGKIVALAQPNITVGMTTFRPTVLISYDGNENPVAVCDPMYTQQINKSWGATPPPYAPNLCQAPGPSFSPPPVQLGYVFPVEGQPPTSYEPYGELQTLTESVAARANTTTLYYPTSAPFDFGQPTMILGSALSQPSPNPAFTPKAELVYDLIGNLACFRTFQDSVHPWHGWWEAQFGADNEVTAVGDPDDGTIVNSICPGKTAGITNGDTAVKLSYHPDRSVATVQTSAERAGNAHRTFTYDAGGNLLSQTSHYGCVVGSACVATTKYWYDAAERLIEVLLPADSRDLWSNTIWATRYLYDLTQNGQYGTLVANAPAGGVTLTGAHGNLFKTQRYIGGKTALIPVPQDTSPPAWQFTDVSATQLDALDRATKGLYFSPGSDSWSTTKYTYDGAGALGLLTLIETAVGDTIALSGFDKLERVGTLTFTNGSGSSPTNALGYSYDANGNLAAVQESPFGTQTWTYDSLGELISTQEPSGGNVTSPSKSTYNYYPNGLPKSIDVDTLGTGFRQFAYRTDGLLAWQEGTYNTITAFTATYTPGGRLTGRGDGIGTGNATDITYAATGTPPWNYGLPSSYSVPPGTYSNLIYDDEGQPTGFTAAGQSVSYTYSTRGELLAMSAPDPKQFSYLDALGALGSATPPPDQCQVPNCLYTQVDMRNAAPLGKVWRPHVPQGKSDQPITYDSAGRQSVPLLQFDVLNRVVQNPYFGQSFRANYQWGPNGHPLLAAQQGVAQSTLHWLGDSVLFTSNGSSFTDVKESSFANYVAGWIGSVPFVIDRDFMGMSAATRQNGAPPYNGAWVVANPYANCTDAIKNAGTLATASPNYQGPLNCHYGTGYFYESRPDSYWDGVTDFHGVRAYEADINAWTSPDAAGGSVGNPISQLPYAYAMNNPMSYQDSTGFDVANPCPPDRPYRWGSDGQCHTDPPQIGHVHAPNPDPGQFANPPGGSAGPNAPQLGSFTFIKCPGPGARYEFTKCTVNILLFTVAITKTYCGGTYASGGLGAGLPGFSASYSHGRVLPLGGGGGRVGPSVFNAAMEGPGWGAQVGFGLGIEESSNPYDPSWVTVATGVFTPQVGMSSTYSVLWSGHRC